MDMNNTDLYRFLTGIEILYQEGRLVNASANVIDDEGNTRELEFVSDKDMEPAREQS